MVRVRQLRIASLMAKGRVALVKALIPKPGEDALGSSANHRGMIKPLSQVDKKFACDEGEGDDTREWWLTAHRRYFARQRGA